MPLPDRSAAGSSASRRRCRPRRLAALHRIVAIADLDGDLLDDPARPLAHHQDAVAERHRLDEIVGDEQRRLAGLATRCGRGPAAAPSWSAHRGRRTARPSAARWDRPRACARAPRAGACRRRAGADSDARSRAAGTWPAGRAPAAAARRAPAPWISCPSSTFSTIVRHGSSRSFCSMKATCRFGLGHPLTVDIDLARRRPDRGPSPC